MAEEMKVEEILAEPEEPGFIVSWISTVLTLLSSNGWYLIGLGALTYYVYLNYFQSSSSQPSPGRPHKEKDAACITNDDARREAVLRLQEKYAKDAQVKAQKDKEKAERKQKERLEEIAKLEEMRLGGVGNRLGSAKKSFRQEYNPLMGNSSTCSREPARKPARGG